MSRKIIGIGETVLDIVFRDNQPVAAVPGGSTFNAMISLGRTVKRDFKDVTIKMITEVGNDYVADIVTSFMYTNGVDTDTVIRNENIQTNISLAFLDSNNNAHYQFYKESSDSLERKEIITKTNFTKNDLVLFGSYFAINPRIHNFFFPLIQKANNANAILFYDINFRKDHLRELSEIADNIFGNCRLSDIIRGSNEDFGILFGTQDPETIYHKHISTFCPIFICTCGPEPIHIFTPNMHLIIPVPQVKTISTIGAGDNFNAGFLYSLLAKRLGKDDLCNISEKSWEEIVTTADSFSIEACCSMDNYVSKDFIPTI